jgi:hypothetical protein
VKTLHVSISDVARQQMESLFADDIDDDGNIIVDNNDDDNETLLSRQQTVLKDRNGKRSKLKFFKSYDDLLLTMTEMLSSDPRSTYRRQQVTRQHKIETQDWPFKDIPAPAPVGESDDRGEYGVCIDILNLRCRFDGSTDPHTVVVNMLEDWSFLYEEEKK